MNINTQEIEKVLKLLINYNINSFSYTSKDGDSFSLTGLSEKIQPEKPEETKEVDFEKAFMDAYHTLNSNGNE